MTTTTMQNDINDTQKELEHIDYIDEKYCEEFATNYQDMHTKIPSRGEILPMETLDEILNHIDYSKIDNYQDWKSYVIAFANQIDTHGKYQTLWKSLLYKSIKFPSYNEKYDDETLDLYHHIVNEKELNEFPKKTIGVNTIWKMLMESDREKWKELAFHKDRVIEGSLFKDLTTTEGLKVFNEHFGMVSDGDSSFYVEWNGSKQDFTMYSEASLIKCFKHLSTYYLAKDDEGNEKKVKVKNFIKSYLEHENKSIYQGQTFSPPPLKPRWNEYNFYRGFKADKDKGMYGNQNEWDIVNSLCKEQLEDELDFMLNHLRILSGEEDTEKCFQYNLKFYAHLLKFPAKLPRVMIIYKGEDGVGVSEWFNYMANIIGSTYYSSLYCISEFIGSFNKQCAYKLLMNIKGIDNYHNLSYELNPLISHNNITIKTMYHEINDLPNYSRLVAFTDTDISKSIQPDSKNVKIMSCNNKYVLLPVDSEERKKYFDLLTFYVESKYHQKCFLRYCREFVDVDIDYDFEVNFPQ